MAQYNRLSNRKRGGGGFQWLLIGFFPGVLCGGLIIFGLLLTGVLQGFGAAPLPTYTPAPEVVLVVTATPDAAAPTNTPFIITATPQPTTESAVILAASPTPTTDPAQVSTQAQTTDAVSVVETVTSAQIAPPTAASATTSNPVPELLQGVVSSMASVPGGTFQMGTTPIEVLQAVDQCRLRDGGNCQVAYGEDSNPPFQVRLDPFQIETTEVTFRQYVTFLNYLRSQGISHLNGCSGFLCIQTVNERPDGGVITFDSQNYNAPPGLVSHPVFGVTWYGAQAYCQAIGRRLPTEAEWERAARGDDGRIYPWGNEWSNALAKTNRPQDAPPGTVPVGSYPQGASPYGVLDMAGNLSEWVNDWYAPDYYAQQANQPQPVYDPQGAPIALEKVLRGGSWDGVPFFARTVHRQSWLPVPDSPNDPRYPRWIGFRCASDVVANAPVSSGDVNPATLGANAGAQPVLPSEFGTATPAPRG